MRFALCHEVLDRLVQKEIQAAEQNDEIQYMQQNLLPINIQWDVHDLHSPLQDEDDEDNNEQGINDGRLDKDEAEHEGGTNLAFSLRLTCDALNSLTCGEAHTDCTAGGCNTDCNSGSKCLKAGCAVCGGGWL